MTKKQHSFWVQYLKSPQVDTSNNLDYLQASLNSLTTNKVKKDTQAERIYSLTGAGSLKKKLSTKIDFEKNEQINKINTTSFINSRVWSFFKKARYLFMSIAMLALLVGYSLKGELSSLVVLASILAVLFFYLLLDLWNYYNGKLVNDKLGEDIEENCLKKCIDEAILEIEIKKSTYTLPSIKEKERTNYIKYLFKSYNKNKDPNNETTSENKDFIPVNIIKSSMWYKCQDLIDLFKKEEIDYQQSIVMNITKNQENEIIDIEEKYNTLVQSIKSEYTEKEKQLDRIQPNYREEYKALLSKSKIDINNTKNELKQATKGIKQKRNDAISLANDQSRKVQRAINREIPIIRSKVITDNMVEIGLNGQKGISEDQLDDFLARISEHLSNVIQSRLAPHSYRAKNEQVEE